MERRPVNWQGQQTVDQQGWRRTANWKGKRTINQSQFQFQIIGPITKQIRYHVPIGLLRRRLQRQSQSISI